MKRLPVAFAIATMLAAPAVSAQDSGFSLKGFGTLGVAHSNSSEADYTPSATRYPSGAGISRQTAFGVDSKLGLQADWKATASLSVTAQALSKLNWEGNYQPDLEWAFAKYSASSDLDIRAGRIRPAIYLLSDFIDVNYANPWIRPPIEFYGAAAISRMEGVDVLWRPNIGDISLLVQPYIGEARKVDLPGGINTLDFKKIMGFNVTAAKGDFTYRIGYIQTQLDYNAPALAPAFAGLAGYCKAGIAGACTAAVDLLPIDSKASFASIGVSYDNGEYFASSEYGQRSTDSMVSDNTSYYVSGGMRLGKWTPFATYSAIAIDSPTKSSVPVTNVATGTVDGIITALLKQGSIFDQHSITLGARYDLAKNVALKAQWDSVSTNRKNAQAGTGSGVFKNMPNSPAAFANRDNTVKVISFAVDFVF